MKKLILSSLLFIFFQTAWSQEMDTLRLESFLDWVRSYHPVARQADITLEMGAMEVRTARGAFDPLLFGNLDQKTFKDTEYYDRREAGITVPTLAESSSWELLSRIPANFLTQKQLYLLEAF